MTDPSDAFGELRSALNRDWTSPELFTHLMLLCQRRHAEAPDEVDQVWVPYAHSHLDRWPSEHRTLSLREVTFDPSTHAPWMGLARRLSLRGAKVDGSRVDAIGLRTTHRALTHLDLGGNRLDELGARRLARLLSRHESLTTLDVSNNRIGWAGAAALVDTLAHTRARDLSFAEVSYGLDGFDGFAAAPVGSLDALSVGGARLEGAHTSAFIQELAAGEVTRLGLPRTNLSDPLVDLFTALEWPRLRALDLTGVFYVLVNATALALSRTSLPALEALTLADVRVDGHAATALAQAPWWGGVRALDASGARTRQELVDALVDAGCLRDLRRLNLSFGKVERGLLSKLAAGAPSLDELSLSGCEVDDWGVVALCEGDAPWTSLDLSYNTHLGGRAFDALAAVSQERPLRALDLRGCHVDARLARRLAGLRVARLDMSGCGLEVAGLKALCAAGALDHTRELVLRDNQLTPQAIQVLRDHEAGAPWRQIDLSDNPLKHQGRAAASKLGAFVLT
jgi:hypothetical protein